MIGPRSPERGDGSSQPSRSALLKALLGERRRAVTALSLSSIVSGFAEAAALTLIAEVAATLVSRTKHVHVDAGPVHAVIGVWALIAIAFATTLIRLVMQIPISVLPARIASDVQAQMRTQVFDAFTRASWELQSRDREGQLQETLTNQVFQATGGALQATGLITSLFTFLALLITAFVLNPAAAAGILIAGVLLFGLLRPLRAIGRRHARELSKAQVQYAGGVGEAVRVAEETQVFGVAAAQRSRIGALVERARELFFSTQTMAKLVPNLFQSFSYILLVAGLALLYAVGTKHPGSLGAIILLLVRSARSGQGTLGNYQTLSQSLPFIERIHKAARRYEESTPPEGRLALPSVQTLAFQDVSYAYQPDRPVLSDVSFEVARGEAVGVIGPTGAGKSTLVQILLQLRTPREGRYLVNGLPAEQFLRADWHNRVAYVPQEPRLLHATVAENIRYFRDLDDDAVERACRLAHIHNDIIGWANGYDTIVGPRADAVSGGQQQRLCLARALAAWPEVLVLDEPTSALDPQSETLIQESLTGLKHELTLFVVAHRMSTLDICDRVMVVIDGRLAAFDTIELLRTHNAYYRSASALAGVHGGGPR